MVKRHMIDAHRLERWGCLNDLVEQCVWFHCAQVPLTLRLSCGARAPQRLCPRPPARRLLQPVVRPPVTVSRVLTHSRFAPKTPIRSTLAYELSPHCCVRLLSREGAPPSQLSSA